MADSPASVCPFSGTPAYPFQRDPAHPFDLAPEVTWLRLEQPMCRVKLWDGQEPWLATRMNEVRDILRDDRFSSSSVHESFPTWSAAVKQQKTTNTSFLRLDKPEHTVQRRLWQAFFTPGNIATLRPAIQQLVDAAIDELIASGPGTDLCKQFAPSVPAGVMSRLLAVPDEDRAFFQRVGTIRTGVGEKPEAVRAALNDLHDYWKRRIDERLIDPGDDLISKLIIAEVKTGRVSRDDLASMANLILLAGFGTTADMIGLGTLLLLINPAARSKLQRDPASTPYLIEEMLRYTSIAQHGLARVAIEDVMIGGVQIRAGEGVITHLASANRDSEHFPNPDQFDIERQSRAHVAFGLGPHACIGAPLARAELQIVFDTLFARLPDLQLAVPFDQVKFRYHHLFFGLEELPVTW